MMYSLFHLREQLFALPIPLIQEIRKEEAISPIPGRDSRLSGLLDIRGQTAVVVEVAQCLFGGTNEKTKAARPKLILLETEANLPEGVSEFGYTTFKEPLVLHVDDMAGIIEYDPEQVEPKPANVREPFIQGVLRTELGLASLLSIPKLVESLIPN
jgi:chemotaxis signal transduction protein